MRGWMVVLAVVACGAAPVTAQERLSDVAGSIELKKPPEGEQIEVELDREVARRPAAARPGESRLLVEIIETARHYGAELQRLNREGPAGGYLQEEWREQVAEAIREIESSRDDLRMLTPPEGMGEAHELARDGSELLAAAGEEMGTMLRTGAPRYLQIRDLAANGGEKLELAMRAVSKAEERRRLEQPPPPIDSFQATLDIDTLCGSRHAPESTALARCVRRQRDAVQRMDQRTWALKPVDDPVFHRIRNSCLREFGDDWYARDLCERQRMEDAAESSSQ